MGVVETNAYEASLSGGATLRFVVPTTAVEVSAEQLPRLDVSGLPGARIAVRRGFQDAAGTNVHVACVEAPSDRWAPGMEEVVFSVANGVAHRALKERLPIDRWEAGSIVSSDERFEQKAFGKSAAEGSAAKVVARHVLGFEGVRQDVVLCSVLCDGLRDQSTCAGIVDQAQLKGLVAAPPPSVLVQAVFFAAERPADAAAILGVVGILVAGLVLAKRPRPRP